MRHIARYYQRHDDSVDETHSVVEQFHFGVGVQLKLFRCSQNPLHRIHANVEIDDFHEQRQLRHCHVHCLRDLVHFRECQQFDHHGGGQQE